MEFSRISVKSYSGFKLHERPQQFSYNSNVFNVVRIIDRWYEGGVQPGRPCMSYFKVLADDEREYVLRYNSLFDAWSIME